MIKSVLLSAALATSVGVTVVPASAAGSTMGLASHHFQALRRHRAHRMSHHMSSRMRSRGNTGGNQLVGTDPRQTATGGNAGGSSNRQ